VTRWAVRIWFTENGQRVFDDLGPFDAYLAQLVCVGMADGIDRGGRWTHVERALIVPWVGE
jgi:hypothetical protein